MYQAHLSIPLEIWVESVPFECKMRYNVGARLIAPPGCHECDGRAGRTCEGVTYNVQYAESYADRSSG